MQDNRNILEISKKDEMYLASATPGNLNFSAENKTLRDASLNAFLKMCDTRFLIAVLKAL